MSQTQRYSIRCPECNHTFDAELYDSVNTRDTPELREQIIQNTLNRVVCPSCSFEFRVDKRLLYHDPMLRVMIYLFPTQLSRAEDIEDEFLGLVTELNRNLPPDIEPPSLHLVLERCELVERIFTLEAGYDPRLVESVKNMMYSQHMDDLPYSTRRLLLNPLDSDEENLHFVVMETDSNKALGVLQFARAAFDTLREVYASDDRQLDLFELFPGPYISARRALMLQDDEEAEQDPE